MKRLIKNFAVSSLLIAGMFGIAASRYFHWKRINDAANEPAREHAVFKNAVSFTLPSGATETRSIDFGVVRSLNDLIDFYQASKVDVAYAYEHQMLEGVPAKDGASVQGSFHRGMEEHPLPQMVIAEKGHKRIVRVMVRALERLAGKNSNDSPFLLGKHRVGDKISAEHGEWTLKNLRNPWTTKDEMIWVRTLTANVHIVARHADGKIFSDQWVHNLRTNAGINTQYTAMSSATGMNVTYIGLSTDTGAPNATDTAMVGELTGYGLSRAAGSFTHSSNATSYTLAYTFTATGAVTGVQKADMSANAAQPVFENTFSSVNLASSDTVAVTWTINF